MTPEKRTRLYLTAAVMGFAATILLFAPLLEGVYEGFMGSGSGQDLDGNVVGIFAILAFFIGFHFKWLRTSL